MSLLSHQGILATTTTTLFDLISAAAPVHWWRNGEASGTVMVDEITTDGTYTGAVSLGNTALYSGGGTTAGGFSSTIYGESAVTPGALNDMTLLTIIRPTNLTGIHLIGVQRDQNAGARVWQWRSNGTSMEFVKIVGGVVTITHTSAFAINTTYMVSFEISSAGSYTMYINAVPVKTGSIAAANYGGAGDRFRIGYATGVAAGLVGTTCENAIFNYVLGSTTQAAFAAAAGL